MAMLAGDGIGYREHEFREPRAAAIFEDQAGDRLKSQADRNKCCGKTLKCSGTATSRPLSSIAESAAKTVKSSTP
jgi:hypothetical protein